eukprot:GEMP01044594.1.p1 GENE.GEMP01044594.1~~GEMP01044594.1.p1  ORF type:complete len:425 (+),score=49.72 GEMP01044594.1:297-1571(+)
MYWWITEYKSPDFTGILVFSEYCQGDASMTAPCPEQRLKLSFMFAVSTSLMNICAMISGALLDICGPKITATGAALCVGTGLAMFGAGRPDIGGEYRYFVGFILFSVSGPLCYMSTISFANYFPKRSGLIISCCVGSFDASSVIFLLLAMAYTKLLLPFESVFQSYSVVPVVLAFACFILYPMTPVHLGKLQRPLSERKRSIVPAETSCEHMSFWQQLGSWHFALTCWVVSVYVMRLNFFIQTMYTQMSATPETSAFKVMAFSMMLPAGGVLFIPLIGFFTDTFRLYICWLVLFIAFSMFEVLLACGPLWDPWFSIASFVFFCYSRPMLYTMGAVQMSRTFGFKAFGRLYGLLFTISGLFCMIQYVLEYIVQHVFAGNYVLMNYLLIFLHITTLTLPWYLYATRPGGGKGLSVASVETRAFNAV